MALTIEDGSIVEGADSYVTLAEARAYASARGVTLPVEDGAVEILARKATDYLETFAYAGKKVQATQPLKWPRKEVTLDEEAWPEDEIPPSLKKAQNQTMMEIFAGLDPLPSSDGKAVIREKVDVIEVEYSDTGSASATPTLPKVLALLEPLFGSDDFSYINVPVTHA